MQNCAIVAGITPNRTATVVVRRMIACPKRNGVNHRKSALYRNSAMRLLLITLQAVPRRRALVLCRVELGRKTLNPGRIPKEGAH